MQAMVCSPRRSRHLPSLWLEIKRPIDGKAAKQPNDVIQHPALHPHHHGHLRPPRGRELGGHTVVPRLLDASRLLLAAVSSMEMSLR